MREKRQSGLIDRGRVQMGAENVEFRITDSERSGKGVNVENGLSEVGGPKRRPERDPPHLT